jgi:hypothetical protein
MEIVMSPEDDYMEIGERGLIPTSDGGFIEKATGRYIDPLDMVYPEDEEFDDEEYDRQADE